jgi:hypothetical protein
VAHEALFRYWESAQKILEDLRKDMLLRERMRHYLVDYQAAGKPADLLLIAGSRLKHGEELLKNREQLLLGNKDGKNLIDYIKKSSEANRATQRRKAWISAAVIVSLSVLLWQKMQLEKAIESNAEQPFQKALKAEGGNKHMAIAYYDTSMDSYKKLTQQDQDNPIYQERIVDEFNNQLIQKTQVGEFAVDGDLAIYEENLNTQRYLATKYPKQPVYLTNLARLSQDIGTQLVESNRYTGTGNKYFLDAISFFERQASEFPEEQEYQINLENGYKDFANLHLKKGGTGSAAEASQYYQKALAVRQKLASKNPQEHRTALGKIYGALSWAALLDKQYQASLDYANLGMEQDSKLYWIKTNIAHALLFLGHTQEAEDIYLHKPDRGMDESALRQSILDDFKEMRRFGLDHPAMQKIETSFNASLQ